MNKTTSSHSYPQTGMLQRLFKAGRRSQHDPLLVHSLASFNRGGRFSSNFSRYETQRFSPR